MAFNSTPFPAKIAYGWAAIPHFKMQRLELDGGGQKRNNLWSYMRHRYDLITGLKSQDDIETLRDHFIASGAGEDTFPFWDRSDYKSTAVSGTPAFDDHVIGTGDGSADQEFQIIKIYSSGSGSRNRIIKLPWNGQTLIGWGGVQKTETTDYTVDYTTGIVTATVPNGVDITWGGQFYVPCFYAVDELMINWEDLELGSSSFPILEDKLY